MEVLELNGNKYVKASSIARELGYTSDYVGQLCRGGKVDAQLVGRSWYVNDESIRSHKNSRYRSTKAKTTVELQKTISSVKGDGETQEVYKVPVRVQSRNFYNKRVPDEAKYTEDKSDLIPVLTEKISDGNYTEIEVRHADAKRISVKKTQKSYSLTPTAKPVIRFRGKVSIIEPVDRVEEVSSDEKLEPKLKSSIEAPKPSKKLNSLPSSRKATMKVEGSNDEPEKVVLRRAGAISMTRVIASDEGNFGELVIQSKTKANTRSARAAFAYITVSLTVAVILGLSAIFVEHSVVVTSDVDTQSSSYVFNLSSVLESLKP